MIWLLYSIITVLLTTAFFLAKWVGKLETELECKNEEVKLLRQYQQVDSDYRNIDLDDARKRMRERSKRVP